MFLKRLQLSSGGAYVQDERYIAIEHMDVRRDCVNSALRDTAQVHPCSLILGFLPRKVPVRQYPPQLQP